MKSQNYESLFVSLFTLHLWFLRIYLAFPIIIMPLAAYIASNWWLLLGIPIFYIGGLFPKYILLALGVAMIFILIATHFDFFRNYTFFLFALIMGSILHGIQQKYKNKLEQLKSEMKENAENKVAEYLQQKNTDT